MAPYHHKVQTHAALKRTGSILILSAVFLAILASRAQAASLSFSTGQGFAVGQTFTANVVVSTAPGESVNAVSAGITFSPSQLQIVSISEKDSIVSMWAVQPGFSNVTGTADLEGVILNPGYAGSSGLVASITFKVKGAGLTTLGFGQAAVLANDGKGTNVLTDAPSKSVYLGSGAPASATTDGVIAGAPSAPVVVSSTNPDPSKWYATSSPSFSWAIPPGVTAVRLQYDDSPVAVPSVLYNPPISSKTLKNIPDGVYYLHVQFKNSKGWGAIAHFKFSIDTVPPAPFKVTEAHPDNTTESRPILYFNTTDALSGMDHYDVKIGDLAFMTVSADTVASNPYTPPTQDPGEKTVIVNATDRAGNITTASTVIDIQALNAPTATNYPSNLTEGDLLRILGKSYPNAVVTVTLKDPDGVETSQDANTTESGNWNMIWTKHLPAGLYTFTLKAVDDKGGQSADSIPYTVNVAPRLIYQIGTIVVNFLSVALLLVAIAAILIGSVMYSVHRLTLLRRRIHREAVEAEDAVRERFSEIGSMDDEAMKHLLLLDTAKSKRELTEEEAQILDSLKKSLGAAEKDILSKLGKIKNDGK